MKKNYYFLFAQIFISGLFLFAGNIKVLADAKIDFAGGDGTQNSPYLIENCVQLQNIGRETSSGPDRDFLYSDYYFKLKNDIDCSATRISDPEAPGYDPSLYNDGAGFQPFGYFAYHYYGEPGSIASPWHDFSLKLDGNYHTISNLTIHETCASFPDNCSQGSSGTVVSGTGLLGRGYGNFKNLTIANADVSGGSDVGILFGQSNSTPTLYNVSVSGSVSGNSYGIGMIGGYADSGTDYQISPDFDQVSASGNLEGPIQVGGLIGYSNGALWMRDSYANVNINGIKNLSNSASHEIGGLVGFADAYPSYWNIGPKFENVYSTGNISTNVEGNTLTNVGGLIGYFSNAVDNGPSNPSGRYLLGYIHNSFSDMSVSGNSSGGLLGLYTGDTVSDLLSTDYYISNSCVSGAEQMNCHNGTTSLWKNNSINAPLNFWDFSKVWKIAGDSFPVFNQDITAPDPVAGLQVSGNNDSSISLAWEAPIYTGKTNLMDYKVQYSLHDANSWTDLTTGGTTISVDNLQENTSYDFKVYAQNSFGFSSESDITQSTNAQPKAPGAPTNFVVSQSENSKFAIDFSWTVPNQGSSPITGYSIQYKLHSNSNNDDWSAYLNSDTFGIDPDQNQYNDYFIGYANQKIDFRIEAYNNSYGWGNYSEMYTYQMPSGITRYIVDCGNGTEDSTDPSLSKLGLGGIDHLWQEDSNISYDTFILKNDIECSTTSDPLYVDYSERMGGGFMPIGFWDEWSFNGILDGRYGGVDHKISNLYINRENDYNIGLFSYTNDASFKNVIFDGGSVLGEGSVGVLVGDAEGITNIDNVNSNTSIVATEDSAGGLIGVKEDNYPIQIDNSNVKANVSTYYTAGGLVGYISSWSNTRSYIKDSSYSGNINAKENSAGGLVGMIYAPNETPFYIENSYSLGTILMDDQTYQRNSDRVGGFVGATNNLHIKNSYSQMLMTSYSMYAGGLVGLAENEGPTDVEIENSYFSGTVSSSRFVGGLMGFVSLIPGGNIINSFVTGRVSSTNDISGNFPEDGSYTAGLANTALCVGIESWGCEAGLTFNGDFFDKTQTSQDVGFVGYDYGGYDQDTYLPIYTPDSENLVDNSVVVNNDGTNGNYFKDSNAGIHLANWNWNIWKIKQNDYPVILATDVVSYLISYTADRGGLITGQVTQNIVSGGNGTGVLAVPNSGYRFVRWSDESTSVSRTDRNITGNHTYNAIFELIPNRSSGGSIPREASQKKSVNVSNIISVTKFIFVKPNKIGSQNNEVKELQKYLNSHGFVIAKTGNGSLGHEINYFGKATKEALGQFQIKNGIIKSKKSVGYGILGPATRKFINSHS